MNPHRIAKSLRDRWKGKSSEPTGQSTETFSHAEQLLADAVDSTGLFDKAFYLDAHTDVAASTWDPFEHYIRWGLDENRAPGAEFDPIWYLKQHADRIKSPEPAMRHYLRVGREEGVSTMEEQHIASHALLERGVEEFFDAEYYIRSNADLRSIGVDPRDHFISFGYLEQRSPGPKFDVAWYREKYLLRSDDNAFLHYLENRSRMPLLPRPANHGLDWIDRYFKIDDVDRKALATGPDWLSQRLRTRVVIVYSADDVKSDDALTSLSKTGGDPALEIFILISKAVPEVIEASNAQYIDYETLHHLMSTDFQGLWVFCRPDIVWNDCALQILPFYYHEHAPLVIYSDFEASAEAGSRPCRLLPGLSPLYFSQIDRLTGIFALNSKSTKALQAVTRADEGFDALWRSAVALDGVEARVVNQLLYSWASSNMVVHPAKSKFSLLPSVTIVIPTRNGVELLRSCLESIFNVTDYEGGYDVLIIDNQSDEEKSLSYLEILSKRDRVRVVKFARDFNYAAMNNFAIDYVDTEMVVFLNNDTVALRSDWLSLLCSIASEAGVGAVGAKLLFPDSTVQHGGCIIGIQGVAAHSHFLLPANSPGFQGLNQITREVSAVTAASLAVRVSTFKMAGGFDSEYLVAFNDIAFCVRLLDMGLRNVWVHVPLMYHLESKTRGYDTTAAKQERFHLEASLFNRTVWTRDRRDVFYNESLSLNECYELAEPPRSSRPWCILATTRPKIKILMLSSTFQEGHGVAVVIAMQVKRLVAEGYEVTLGGPLKPNEVKAEGAVRFNILDTASAARVAVRHRFDIVVAHTPPFFSIVRYLGSHPTLILYDYGEPPAVFFPDAVARSAVNTEKRLCFAMAKHRAAISETVAKESDTAGMTILPLGNSHLAALDEDAASVRKIVRSREGWDQAFVILNVCRFQKGERYYKGVFDYIDVTRRARMMNPDREIVVLLCGKGGSDDVKEMTDQGLVVVANPSDEELLSYYHAADLYISLSKWEGYNLTIGQALAVGLPVLASRIPAHKAFGVETFEREGDLLHRINAFIRDFAPSRTPRIWHWDDMMDVFSSYVSRCHKDDLALLRNKLAGLPNATTAYTTH